MFAKLIRSVTGDADKRAQDAQAVAATALRKLEAAAEAETTALRGSGSWDTDYMPAQEMQPLPRAAPAAPKPPARVAIHAMRLMTPAHLAVFNMITDRLEVEAPDMTLHAQVSLDAFLHVDRRAAQTDQDAVRAGFVAQRVDILILDDAGLPVAALDFIGNTDGAGPLAKVKAAALEEAGIGYVTANELTPPDDIWAQVFVHLYLEDDDLPEADQSDIAV